MQAVGLLLGALGAAAAGGWVVWRFAVLPVRRELHGMREQMDFHINQMRQAVADWEQDRKAMNATIAQLREANRHAYETIKDILSAPGVDPSLAGKWLYKIIQAGPARDSDAGGLSPVTGAAPAGRDTGSK